MRKNPVSEILDIPQFSYFEFQNPFSGSYGTLSYKITPSDSALTVQISHSRLCSEKAEIEEEKQYPMNLDGFHELIQWLEMKVPGRA